jgi:hypothetical protein
MVAKQEQQKGLLRGKRVSSAILLGLVNVTVRVASWLRNSQPKRYIVSLPKGRSFGKAFYTVQSSLNPVTFTKKKDAEAFKKLLEASTASYQSDIVRHEITDKGYML